MPTCKHAGCIKIVRSRGVCVSHGSKRKSCSNEGCTNVAKNGGVCRRHGTLRTKNKIASMKG